MHPRDLSPCDLVMKGGAASGVVYPGAVLELSNEYRFANLGGTSAGAVAAALAAAAEFGRQRAGRLELGGVEEIIDQLAQPGFVQDLFQPAPAGRSLLALALSLRRPRSRGRRSRILVTAAIRHRSLHAAFTGLGAAIVVVLLAPAFQDLAFGIAVALLVLGAIVLMLLGGWAILAPLGSMVRGTWRALPAQGFGSVPLLLSSLKLYSARPDLPGPVESFMSDGGITSNFPIHFFDDWLPSHPTLGLAAP